MQLKHLDSYMVFIAIKLIRRYAERNVLVILQNGSVWRHIVLISENQAETNVYGLTEIYPYPRAVPSIAKKKDA